MPLFLCHSIASSIELKFQVSSQITNFCFSPVSIINDRSVSVSQAIGNLQSQVLHNGTVFSAVASQPESCGFIPGPGGLSMWSLHFSLSLWVFYGYFLPQSKIMHVR